MAAQAKAAAEAFRRDQHLGNAPIADLVTVLEGVPNVHVAIEPAIDDEQHGMRATDPNRGVTVLAASATPHAVRLRSTLAHELGHHIFNDPTPAVWSENTPEERRATEFARHLLIPQEGLIDLLGAPGTIEVTDAVLSKVVERFAVSPGMAAIQLREAGFINASAVERLGRLTTRVLATRYGWLPLYRQWSDDSNQPRPPRRIVAVAIDAYLAHDATIATVANLHGMVTPQMRAEFDAAGVNPEEPEDVQPDIDELGEGAPVDWSSLDAWDDTDPEDEAR
ncbi:hypothetical protein JCM18899A_00900 [Nocardioides sp. AN3]